MKTMKSKQAEYLHVYNKSKAESCPHIKHQSLTYDMYVK